MSRRKIYSEELKRDAVRRVEAGLSQAEVCRELGLSQSMLSRWVVAARTEGSDAFRGNGVRTADAARLKALEDENRRLKTSIEILKKAHKYFMTESR